VFDFANANAELLDIMAYATEFSGGVRVASGDVNGDGRDDVFVGTGPGTRARVKAFSGLDGSQLYVIPVGPAGYTGGVHVGAGDVNGDGFFDVIAGTSASSGATVRVFDGQDGSLAYAFNPFPGSGTVEIRVAGADLTGDDRDDLIVGRGPSTVSTVQTFDGVTRGMLDSFRSFGLSVLGGIFVEGY
jgi:hypothetical protein